jgi:hypothetical protein
MTRRRRDADGALFCPSCAGLGLLDDALCAGCGGVGAVTLEEWLAAVAEEIDEETDAPRGHERLDLEPTDPEALEKLKGKVWAPFIDVDERGGIILGEVWIDDTRAKDGEDDGAG